MKLQLEWPALLGLLLFAGVSMSGCGTDGAPDAEAEQASAAQTAGSKTAAAATLAIGDDTWTFDRVFCAFGEDTGQDDISFSLSARQDGMQLDAQISERFGHAIDISSLDGTGSDAWNAGEADPGGAFLQLDGKHVSAETTFTNSATGDTAEGTLSADCP
ncbi:MAG: hypothetical protein PVF05_03250 [Gemmatimonadales bacterium]|jgi:hypothetical protein